MTPEEIDAEIKRLTELKQVAVSQPAPRGRPPLAEDELYAREMARKRAKQRAAEDFKREEAERQRRASMESTQPTYPGLWQYGKYVVAVSKGAKGLAFMRLVAGVVTPPASLIDELEPGLWQLIECDPVSGMTFEDLHESVSLLPVVSVKMRDETTEHLQQTALYLQRRIDLAEQGKKPCINIWCTATLEPLSFSSFCRKCEAKMKELGKNTLKRDDMA